MPVMTIDVPELDRIIRAGIEGFDAPQALPKPRVQLVMERTIRALHREGELELAASVLMVHCCRAEGGGSLHRALELLVQHRADRSAGRKGGG